MNAIQQFCGGTLTAVIATLIAVASPYAEDSDYSPELKATLKKEKAYRKACKIEICSALRNQAPGRDIACPVIKTWPKQDISKLIKRARVSWPWGDTKCDMVLTVPREILLNAARREIYEAAFPAHTLICKVNRKEPGKTYTFKVTATPSVTFQNGRATAGNIKWGKIEAPLVAKSVLWPATALDNKVGVFNDDLVKALNTFITTKCDEVKSDWKSG